MAVGWLGRSRDRCWHSLLLGGETEPRSAYQTRWGRRFLACRGFGGRRAYCSWAKRAAAGGGRGDRRDHRGPSPSRRPVHLGRHWLRPVQRHRGRARGVVDRAALRLGVQPRQVVLRACVGCGCHSRELHLGNRRGGFCVVPQFDGTGPDHLVSLVRFDALGIVTVAPLLIGLASVTRDPPPRSEIIDGGVALMALAFLGGLIIFLPRAPWVTVVPVALVFPFILWLAARCRPAFAAAAAFIIAFTVVWATTFGIGFFGDVNFPIAERVLTAQAGILAASLCALVLAALFSERRESEASLIRSNMMLQRERNNKLMNLEAMAASIAHEVSQPLTAIAANGSAALRFIGRSPPNLEEARSALDRIITASRHAGEVFENIRALFGSADQRQQPIDVNEIVLGALRALRGELDDHGVTTRTELTSGLPLVMGHSGQLQEVLLNLARNAIEAMDAVKGSRVLEVRTERDGTDAVIVAVRDTGPGIDPAKSDRVFDPFVTTKAKGMGLGLAICRMIIERHRGQITASSDGKRGALFQFVLPIKSVGGDPAPKDG